MAASLNVAVQSAADATHATALAFTLWRVSDHGAMSEISHRPGTTPSAWIAAYERLGGPESLASYDSTTSAFVPLGIEGGAEAPYIVLPIKTKDGPAFVGVSFFRHAPRDALIITATKDPKTEKWKVTNLDHVVDD